MDKRKVTRFLAHSVQLVLPISTILVVI